jgi:hypothetical protein
MKTVEKYFLEEWYSSQPEKIKNRNITKNIEINFLLW